MSRWQGRRQLTRMAAPMAAWVLHLVVVYSLVGLACAEGWPTRRVAGLPLLIWVMLAMTAAALMLIVWLGWRAARAQPDTEGAASATAARRRLVDRATAVLAVVAFIAVAFTTAPMFSLPPCL